MLQSVKAELKFGAAASAQFVEDALARHMHFSSSLLESGLASAKQMRACTSLPDALKIPSQFAVETQQGLLELGFANTRAVLGLGKSCVGRIRRGLSGEPRIEAAAESVRSVLPEIVTAEPPKKAASRTRKRKATT
jgi:hypothetical protein